MELTAEQKVVLAICAMNKHERKVEIRKEWRVLGLRIVFHWQSRNSFWGRFGGGWNWELGFAAGGRTVIINLLIASLRIERLCDDQDRR